MMRRPWVVGVEVPWEGNGEGRHGRADGVVPLEWWGAPGRRHAVRTVIKAVMAQLQPPVGMDMPLAGCRGHRSCGQPLGGGSCGGGPPTRGDHWTGGGTLRAPLSGTFLQSLPDLVTPLKGHSLSPRSVHRRGQRPPKGSGTNMIVEAT